MCMENNILNNSFTYSGKVTINKIDIKSKRIIETKIIKNAGTKSLFKFLCDCLTGNFSQNSYPRYLDASSRQVYAASKTTNNQYESCLYFRSILETSNVVEVSGNTLLSDNSSDQVPYTNYHVKYATTIMLGQIKQSETTVSEINSLFLCADASKQDTSDNVLAWINLVDANGESDPIQIGTNQAILIEWDMSFDNLIPNEQKIQES